MAWSLVISSPAEKELKRLHNPHLKTVIRKINTLKDDPFPSQSKRLKGTISYRLRIGNYRVLYEVDRSKKFITVYAIGHRKDIYRMD